MSDPCVPDFTDEEAFLFNSSNYLEDFIVGYYIDGCNNYNNTIRNFLVWMRGRKTFYTAAGIPLYNLENSGDMTYKNNSGTITMHLTPQGDITHPGNMSTGGNTTIDGNTLMKGKLNVRDVTTFEIPNPASPGSFLNHGALQSREHALYFRGVGSGTFITLPTSWGGLVDESTITVHLTPSAPVPVPNYMTDVYLPVPTVGSITSTTVTVWNPYLVPFHYLIIGKRKDVPNA